MKKLINAVDDFVPESLEGLALAHGDLVAVNLDPAVVYRTDAPRPGKVGLVSGGGSGHEPMHGGFVGLGMLDAACPGAVFTSPTPDQMEWATNRVDGGAGVTIDDDVAVKDSLYTQGRRGVGGTVLLEKLAGAKAEEGANLDSVTDLAKQVIDNVRSMGLALTSCSVPADGTVHEVSARPIERTLSITCLARSVTLSRLAPSSALAPASFSSSTVPPTPRLPWV